SLGQSALLFQRLRHCWSCGLWKCLSRQCNGEDSQKQLLAHARDRRLKPTCHRTLPAGRTILQLPVREVPRPRQVRRERGTRTLYQNLVSQSQAELENPRIVSLSDNAEVAAGQSGSVVATLNVGPKLSVIPGVVGLSTEFQGAAPGFAEHEALVHGEVPIVSTWSSNRVMPEVAECARSRHCKRVGIKPLDARGHLGFRVADGAHEVGPRACLAIVGIGKNAAGASSTSDNDIQRCSRLHGNNPRELPAAER